jgi:steroid delta-isomerase-like uncharacterized protein
MSDENKALVHRYLDLWNLGRPELIGEVCADDYVEYDPAYPGGKIDRDGVKQLIAMYKVAFPDLQFVVLDLIAEAGNVAVYWRMAGTNQGEFRGQPPTGQHGETEGMTLMRFRDGMLFESRTFWDPSGFRRQVGTEATQAASA